MNKAMKRSIIFLSVGILLLAGLSLVSGLIWRLPFIPSSWRNHFVLNANIVPASDDARSLFVAINPGWRAEFGDRDHPESAFFRFELAAAPETVADTNDINPNLWDVFHLGRELLADYHPGIEWQLFMTGIDETQVAHDQVQSDATLVALTKEILGETLIATTPAEIEQVLTAKAQITTTTTVKRHQGYDSIDNMQVASATDLQYLVKPGQGIATAIILGDRQDFDTACLKLLSLTSSDQNCALPYNRFGFLLQLDPGQQLKHSPLALDGGQTGTDYIVDQEDKFLLRLGNWQMIDSAGAHSRAIQVEIRPGEVSGQVSPGYYIVTVIADLKWLIDSDRVFPVRLESGFYTQGGEFFQGELAT
jgi:hypothetical protein